MKEGKTLNPEYPDYFLNRIKEEALFEGLGDDQSGPEGGREKAHGGRHADFKAEDPTKPPGRRAGRGGAIAECRFPVRPRCS